MELSTPSQPRSIQQAARAVARERKRSVHRRPGKSRRPLPTAVTRGPLDDGLRICLSLLEHDPERFEAAAVAWHRRWCAELPGIGFAESQSALSALSALKGNDPAVAGESLRAACRDHALDKSALVLDAWLVKRGAGRPAPSTLSPKQDASRQSKHGSASR